MSLLIVLYDMILVAYCGVSELHEQVGYSCLSNLLVLQLRSELDSTFRFRVNCAVVNGCGWQHFMLFFLSLSLSSIVNKKSCLLKGFNK